MFIIRYAAFAFFILMTVSSHASSIDNFLESLKEELLLTKTGRNTELDQALSVRPFNALDRVLSPDASATYNGVLNQIKLNSSLLVKDKNSYAIKSAHEILGPLYMGAASVVTVFHELGHAEMDILIENRRGLNDELIMSQYHHKIKDVFKRNFKGNPWTIFHEYFAYYRTDLAEGMLWDKGDIYRENGYRKETKSCFLTGYLKAQLEENISLEDFQKFHALRPEKNYREGAAPRYIFVRGKDYDLSEISEADQKIIMETNNLFWMYHLEEYGFPTTQKVLVERMNQRDPELESFRGCREELYFKNR